MGRLLNKKSFEHSLVGLSHRQRRYYNGRWKYYRATAKMLKGVEFDRVLELGPDKILIVNDSDCMVIKDNLPRNRVIKNLYEHDATDVPWPIKDKQYDLFVALQVWEHLGLKRSGNHEKAFKEVMRISNMAILSFPYKWKSNKEITAHGNIDDEIISRWTLNIGPVKQRIVTTGRKKRKIVFFKF